MKTKAIILDLDGTLYNRRGLRRRMVWACRGEWGILRALLRTRKKLKGSCFASEKPFFLFLFSEMAQRTGKTVAQVEQWYREVYLPTMVQIIRQEYKPCPWVVPFLEQCREKQVPVVLLSDYEMVEEKLQALGIDADYFTYRFASSTLGGLKPNLYILKKISAMLHIAPEEFAVIGDRDDTDGAMARAAEAKFIAACPQHAPALRL